MAANLSRFFLYKRRNQIYYVEYYHDEKRRCKSTWVTTRPEALKALTQFRELLQERSKQLSLRKFIEKFLAFTEGNHRPGTPVLYLHTPKRLVNLVGDISLVEVTPEHFDQYKVWRLKQKTEAKEHPEGA